MMSVLSSLDTDRGDELNATEVKFDTEGEADTVQRACKFAICMAK